ncbi:MAG: GH3 family domain-containing protein, partial [Gemmataceae bacterium]
MLKTSWLAPFTNTLFARRIADAALVKLAHRRTLALDMMDAGAVQERTLLKNVRKAQYTKFGQDHQFRQITCFRDFQDRVPVRDYEFFWNNYWKTPYPRLDDVTWPGKIPYYALSSGTTSGATKYIPI